LEGRVEIGGRKTRAVRLELPGVDLLDRRIRMEEGRPGVEEDGADRD
jgi:hypothetical protein